MFGFLSKVFGASKQKTCCGSGACHDKIDIASILSLTDSDMERLRKLDPKIVIGKVLERTDHPDPKMTKVKVTKTDIGNDTIETILCGGTNLEAGDVVVVATVGAKLSPDFEIGVRAIRGVESRGMICARSELGLSLNGEEKGHIWKLPSLLETKVGKKVKDL